MIPPADLCGLCIARNCEQVIPARPLGADSPRFRRIMTRSAHSKLYSGMILAGHVGRGGGVCKTGFLSLALSANAGIGGTGGGGEEIVGLGGGEW